MVVMVGGGASGGASGGGGTTNENAVPRFVSLAQIFDDLGASTSCFSVLTMT